MDNIDDIIKKIGNFISILFIVKIKIKIVEFENIYIFNDKGFKNKRKQNL